jgi:hypothetical protein
MDSCTKALSMDKLSKDLISIGETEARDCMKVINAKFLMHKVSKFIPAYKIKESNHSSKGGEEQ